LGRPDGQSVRVVATWANVGERRAVSGEPVADGFAEFAGDPDFGLNSRALLPPFQRQHHDFVASFQKLAVVPLPELPIGREPE
jgi:hypothetical protein